MKVFSYSCGNEEMLKPTQCDFVISVDIGIQTGAVTIYNLKDKNIFYDHITGVEENIMKASYPYLLVIVKKAVFQYKTIVDDYFKRGNQGKISWAIELPVYRMGASIPLHVFLTVFLQFASKYSNTRRIDLVPNNLGAFFLRKKKSSKSEVVSLVREQLKIPKRISSHEADSLLISMFTLFDTYKVNHSVNLRQPNYEIEYLGHLIG